MGLLVLSKKSLIEIFDYVIASHEYMKFKAEFDRKSVTLIVIKVFCT